MKVLKSDNVLPCLFSLRKAQLDFDMWLWLYRLEAIVMHNLPYSMRMFRLEEVK